MPFRLISEVRDFKGKVAVVRLDTNVPLKARKVLDDSRLRQAVPTLRYLERRGVGLVLLGHLGRPQGKPQASLSLKPVGYALGKLLRQPVQVLPVGRSAAAIRRAANQGVVLLENIRFEAGEDDNSPELAKELATLGDLYVNEAFSVSHRRAASLVGITKHLPSYAGFSLAQEVAALEQVRRGGAKPVVAVIGGAKVRDKLPVIKKLLPRLKAVLVGGAVSNTFLLAKGYRVGRSLVDRTVLTEARSLLRQSQGKIILPLDAIVDRLDTRKFEATWRAVGQVRANERMVDLGTRTTQAYATYLKSAPTVFWSGPLGLVEQSSYRHATLALGRLAAAHAHGPAFVLVGGGDTVAFFHEHKLWVDHFSLAGGAMLEFLAGDKLPALKALGYR